jgi:hypothetical protein
MKLLFNISLPVLTAMDNLFHLGIHISATGEELFPSDETSEK